MENDSSARVVHQQTLLNELGLTTDATIQSVQRRLHVGVADAMRLLALREEMRSGDAGWRQLRCSEFEILEAMHRYGGGFVKQLALLYRLADVKNKRTLADAFRHYFEQYDEMAFGAMKSAGPTRAKECSDV